MKAVVKKGEDNARLDLAIDTELFSKIHQLVGEVRRGTAPTESWWMNPATRLFCRRWFDAQKQAYDNLSAPAIEKIAAAGLIEQHPWDDRSIRSVPDIHEYGRTTDDHAWESMLSALSASSQAIMLDRGVESRLAFTGQQVAKSAVELRRMNDLMAMISSLSSASLDEVIDIRNDLQSQLLPFRAFLLNVARSSAISEADSIPEANRQLRLAWDTQVLPNVVELEESIQRDTFLRKLAQESVTTGGALLSVGVGVGGALAAGPLGLTQLSAFGAAALPLFTKALQATAAAKKTQKENPVFFVVQARRRLKNG